MNVISEKPIVKKGEQYKNEYGVVYIVLSVSLKWEKGRHGNQYRHIDAITRDFSVDNQNGTWDGAGCHWAEETNEWKFIANFQKLA